MIMVILKKMMSYIQRLTVILCALLFIHGCMVPPLYKEKKTVFKLSKEADTEVAFSCVLDNIQKIYMIYLTNYKYEPNKATKSLTINYKKGNFKLMNYKAGISGVPDSIIEGFRKDRKLILYEKLTPSFFDSKLIMARDNAVYQIQNCLDNIQ